jgi:hypothetical protein
MYVPELVSPGSRLEHAVREAVRYREVWAMVVAGELSGTKLVTPAARAAALERCLAASLVLAGQRHGVVLGPVAGFVVSADLRRARLVELVWMDLDPFQEGALTRHVLGLVEAVSVRARLLHPELELSLPAELRVP